MRLPPIVAGVAVPVTSVFKSNSVYALTFEPLFRGGLRPWLKLILFKRFSFALCVFEAIVPSVSWARLVVAGCTECCTAWHHSNALPGKKHIQLPVKCRSPFADFSILKPRAPSHMCPSDALKSKALHAEVTTGLCMRQPSKDRLKRSPYKADV